MKEPAMITCPHCGKDTPAGDVCRHCNKDIGSLQELEVQYRDFKGSEMLDIKMSSPARHQDGKPGKKLPEAAESNRPPKKKSTTGKTLLFIGAAALIVIAALAWYYLLKFFLKF